MIDGRLLIPAAAGWLGAALTTWALALLASVSARHATATSAAVVSAGVVAAGAAGFAVATRRQPPSWVVLPLLAVSFGALGVLAAAAGVVRLSPEPVASWVDARATATVRGTVSGEALRQAAPTAAWSGPDAVDVPVAGEGIAARGGHVEVDVPLVVRLPAGADTPPPGTVVEVLGRLSPTQPRSGVAARVTVRASRAGSVLAVVAGPGLVDRAAHAMRAGLRASLHGVDREAGALVAGLAVGDDSGQPADLTAAMRASGLSHLTAVSGGNVAIVMGVVLGLAALVGLRLWQRVLLGLAALGYFVVLVGPEASVLRASVMGAVAVVGTLVGGRRGGPSVLAAGVMLLLAFSPWLALSWGFGLSVFATGGLILLAPAIRVRLARWALTRRWPPAVREAVSLTTAAQLATLPLLVGMGGAVGWVAVPANLAAMPVVAPITVLGLAAAGLAPVLPWASGWAAHAAAVPAGWIAITAHTAAELPVSRAPWPDGWAGVGVVAALIAVVVVLRAVGRRLPRARLPVAARWLFAGIVILIGALGVALPPDRQGWPPDDWLLIMCDVGQGDALLVHSGDGSAVVVDSGPDPDRVDRCLADAGIRAVPALVLTHFHADHVGGVAGVLRGRTVASVLATPVREPLEEADRVDTAVDAVGLDVQSLSAGDQRVTGEVSWRVIWPRRRISTGSVPNNASVVLVVRVRDRTLLLAGDIEPEAQAAIAPDLVGTSFDAVKVPHHGSRFQSPLLTSWAPAPIALVSVGAGNDYGHPAPETVAAWEALGAVVARTDRDGDVAVVAVGSGVGVVTRGGMLPSS